MDPMKVYIPKTLTRNKPPENRRQPPGILCGPQASSVRYVWCACFGSSSGVPSPWWSGVVGDVKGYGCCLEDSLDIDYEMVKFPTPTPNFIQVRFFVG